MSKYGVWLLDYGPLITADYRDFRKTGPSFVTGCIHLDLLIFRASLYAHTILVELSVNSFGCVFSSDIVAKQLSVHMPPPSPTSEKSYNLGKS